VIDSVEKSLKNIENIMNEKKERDKPISSSNKSF